MDAILGNRASQLYAVPPVRLRSLSVGPSFHECDNKQIKN